MCRWLLALAFEVVDGFDRGAVGEGDGFHDGGVTTVMGTDTL
jgi:hypothetical protein